MQVTARLLWLEPTKKRFGFSLLPHQLECRAFAPPADAPPGSYNNANPNPDLNPNPNPNPNPHPTPTPNPNPALTLTLTLASWRGALGVRGARHCSAASRQGPRAPDG